MFKIWGKQIKKFGSSGISVISPLSLAFSTPGGISHGNYRHIWG
jgi:hypothetical protein